MVKYFHPKAHGCGRDQYIHMGDEVRKGKVYLVNSNDSRKSSRPRSAEMTRIYTEESLRQTDVSSRLATPSGRQYKAAAERSRRLFEEEFGRLRMAMPFTPGVTLKQRDDFIRQIYAQEMSPLASPLNFSPTPPTSPITFSPRGGPGQSVARIPRRGRA